MIDDQEYWNEFYSQKGISRSPSSFAKHAENHYLQPEKRLLELGCGNGRDAIFFAEHRQMVTALDLSSQSIQELTGMGIRGAKFIEQDFSQLAGYRDFDYVYSRFTLHSVDQATEDRVFQELPNILVNGGLFLMEARSLKDEGLKKVFGEGHFRRYLDFEITLRKIEELGFEFIEKIESQGLSPYKEEDPFLIRIVARKL